MDAQQITWGISQVLGDEELEALHAAAFGGGPGETPWMTLLQRHSLFWVAGRQGDRLVAFVNVVGDGGAHAIVLDTCVAPDLQGHGIGAELIRRAADEAARRGCAWLHADYEPHLAPFYESRCGLRPTHAGLLHLA